MFAFLDRRLALVPALAAGAIALGLVGCEEPAEIRVQSVPKQVIEPEEFAGLADQEHVILVAMVPQGNEAWIFRVDGPREDVQMQREEFESFIASVSFPEGASQPQWNLPAGWEESAAAERSLREATIRVPIDGGSALDLSVSRLPVRGDWLHYRLRNFNRWRAQLQLPVAGAGELAAASEAIELSSSAEATVIRVAGKFAENARVEMPAGVSPSMRPRRTPEAAGSRSAGLTYTTPEGWGPGPTNSMRRASFVISADDRQATVVVTAFSRQSGPQMTSPLANVNRWRRQLQLPPVSEEQLAETTEPVQIGGQEGIYVALDGSAGPAAELAMRAAMVEHGDLIWFFKLDGPREIVEGETEHFRQFLRSVEFE